MSRTLIHIIVHFVLTNGRAVRVHLAAILDVQVHEFGLVAAHAELRLEKLGPTGDVPAAVAGQWRVAASDSRLDLARRLPGLLEAVYAGEGTLGGRGRIEHVRVVLPDGVAAERGPRAHLVERIALLGVIVDAGHERLALAILQHVLMPRLEVKADEVVEAFAFGYRTHQVLVAARLLTHVVGLAQPAAIVDARRLVYVRVVNDNLGVYVGRVDPFTAEVLRKVAFGLHVTGHFGSDDHLMEINGRILENLRILTKKWKNHK